MLGQLSVIANAVLRELSGYNAEQNIKARYKNSTKEVIKVEDIKHELLEKDKFIKTLQAQLHQAHEAMKLDKSSADMEELVLMKQQLQEKEELIITLRTQLSQTQGNTADIIQSRKNYYAEETKPDVSENIIPEKHKDLIVFSMDTKEAEEDVAFLKSQLQGKRLGGDSEVLDQKEVELMEREGAFCSHDDINDHLLQLEQLKGRISELEMEKQSDRELRQTLEKENNALLSQISAKDDELKLREEEITNINKLNQQIQEELSQVTKLKAKAEEEKYNLEERLTDQLAELKGSTGKYVQDVADAQIKNEQLESEMQNLKKCMSDSEEEKQQLVTEKTKVESEIRKEYLEKKQGGQKGPRNRRHAKELQKLLRGKQLEVTQLQKDCLRYQERTSTLEKTVKAQLKEMEGQKEELELKMSSTTSVLTQKSEEVFLLREQISKQDLEIQNLKAASQEAKAHAESLQQELESSQVKLAGLEHLKTLQPELDELQKHTKQKEEEVSYLSGQLSEKEQTLTKVQAEMMDQEHLIRDLHTQLEMQAKEHEEQLKQFQVEVCELKQKSEEVEEEAKAKQQVHRKLQAALISRKAALKENKNLQEELSSARDAVAHLTKSLADVESQVSVQNKEKDAFLGKLALLQEERDKLVVEMDKCLLENQSLGGFCESLKLALEGHIEEKEKLMKELESLRCSNIAESTEWQEKHKELQKKYAVLLQSYENTSNEVERIQHVVASVRQDKEELNGKLRSTETDKREMEKQLQDAEQEMEQMKEKVKKFAKSKQQKILKLEEENDRLRAEAQALGGAKESMDALLSSNYSLKEELERVKLEYKTLSKEFGALMAEKSILSEEIQDLKLQREESVLKQASLEATEKFHEQKHVITEEETQALAGKSQEQDTQSVSVKLEHLEGLLSANGAKPGTRETLCSRDDSNDHLLQLEQLKGRISELEMEKPSDRELRQTLEKENNALLSQISAKDGELKLREEEVTNINTLNQQIQEELSQVTKLKAKAEEEKYILEERLTDQLAEHNGSIGKYVQDVADAQIKNEQLESKMQNLKKCMSDSEEEKQQLVTEKTKVESEIRKEYLEKKQGDQKGPGNRRHAKELQGLLRGKQLEVTQLQKDCLRYQERTSTLEKTVKAQVKEMEGQKEELELKISSTTSELTPKSEEVFLLREQISKQDLEIQNLKAASHEAKAHAESLQQELESSQLKLAGLEHLKTLQPELDELQKHTKQKEEEVSYLSGQLSEKEQTLTKVLAEMMDQEHLIRDLHTQLEMQAKEHEEQLKQFQVEVCELKQKSEEVEEEAKAKQQVHRKLQAALISRKAALKENKNLQEELSSARDAVAHLTKSLTDLESQVSVQNKEKDAFLGKLALLQEERDKLVVEMDKCLLENQSLGGSCESLKLALEGHIEEKEKLMKELESLRCSNIAESTEWQEKHKELQKKYAVLLQSYENTSNEVERIQHVVASVRQDKEELNGKLRSTETDKREMEKQLQDAEQEMEQMKEKVKKFAKSKQQKILKLEEENDRLRAEAQALGGAKESMDALLSSNSSLKEELERVKLEYKTLSKEFGALMAEKSILSEEIQDLKLQREESVLKQASLEATEKFHEQKHVITEEETQALAGKSQEQDTQSVSVKLEHLEGLLSANGAKPGTRESLCSRDDINDHLLQLEQLKGRISELEMEKPSDRELRQTLEKENNALLSQISAKDGELKLREEEVTNINTLNQQIQEELSQVTKLKAKAEEEKYILEERLTDQLAEHNGSIGKYVQDVADAQIKNEQLESKMQNLKKCMSDSEEEKQQLVTEKTKVESEIRKEYLEKKQGDQKGPGNRRHAKELQGLLRGKQLEVTQLQKDCLRYQERTSTLEKTVKAQVKEMEGQKEELELKISSTTSELTPKSEEVFLLREQISKQDLEIQNLKAASHEAKAHAESLQQELESSQLKLAGLEHLKTLQPELDELQKHTKQKEEEVSYLSGQLSEKEQTLTKVLAEMMDQEHLIRDLHTQLEMQAKEHEEQLKQFQVEVCELKQKSEEVEEEAKAKQQVHRKLQAALISRKAALKENKNLQEELSSARDAVAHLTKSLTDLESQVSVQNKEKDAFLGKLALLQEERDKLVVEMDKCLLENQSLGGSCESLKLALEGHIEEKEKLMKELESLRCSNIAESTEWQEKHKELQKKYEVLLQSYENTSNEVERIQHVVASVRQDKEELNGKLRSTETDKREMEKQLQDAEQEMEQMKEKVKKFAKSKQQKILKLEEENDRLRAEAQALGGAKESMDALLSSNYSLKEELERVKLEYKTLSKEFGALMAEKSILSEEIQDLKLQREESVLKQASLEATEKFHEQKHVITEEETQALAGKSQEQDTQSVSVKHSEGLLSANGAKPGTRETPCSRDDINDHLLQLEQLKGRISELEMEKQSDRELRQTLEKENNALLSQISAKDGELKLREEEITNINTLNQQIQEELSQVTKLKAKAEEEKYILEERLTDQLAELNVSIGKYDQDVGDAQIKNEQLESEMQNLKKCMSDSEEEKQQLVTEKTKVESEIRKEYLEKKQGGQKGPGNRRHAKELQGLLRGKQLEVTQLQKDCLRYQERTSTLEKTVKAQVKEMEGQKEELELKMSSTTSELTPKSEEVFLSREQISKQDLEIQNLKAASHEAKAHADSLQQELESSQLKLAGLEHLKTLQPELDELQKHTKQKEEEVSYLSGQLSEKEQTLTKVQAEMMDQEHLIRDLHTQLEMQAKEHEEQLKQFQVEVCELKQKSGEVEEEAKAKQQVHRKLQAALISRKAALKENKNLQEELSSARDAVAHLTKSLADVESQVSVQNKEKDAFLGKLALLQEERDKLVVEMDKCLLENQSLGGSCESLKLALEGHIDEKAKLMKELESLRYHNSTNELAKLESELKSLKDQSTDLNESLEKCKENKESLEGIIKQQEADIQNCKFNYEQLKTDLKASRELTGRLQDEIIVNEQKFISLLSGKEAAIQAAVAELHQQHHQETKKLENLLSQKEEENVALEEENKKAVEKTNQLMETLENIKKENLEQKAQLDSFVKSMSSLQDDRDRIISDYQQLEDRHFSIILEKDQLIQEVAVENNKLKEEIRWLRNHMDDLNSENAKLDAQLIQYRQDLNQVISIKDCQQKQLLEAQLQQNKELRNECSKLKEKLKGSEEARQSLQWSSDALQGGKRGLSTEIESLKRQVTALQEVGTLGAFPLTTTASFENAMSSLQKDRDRLFSQLLEEKNSLSVQLSKASQSLRESQHHYSNLFKHCAVLEKQVQELQAGTPNALVPEAPQEMNGKGKSGSEASGELQPSLSEVQQQLCSMKQEVNELKLLLKEERDQRLAIENALSLAKEQIRRLVKSECDPARTPVIGACGSQETSVLIDIPGSSCQRTQSGVEWKRVVHSLCRIRTRGPLLATIYFLMVHVLLCLYFTGYL